MENSDSLWRPLKKGKVIRRRWKNENTDKCCYYIFPVSWDQSGWCISAVGNRRTWRQSIPHTCSQEYLSGNEVVIPCQIVVRFKPDYPALFSQTDFPVLILPVFDLSYCCCYGYTTPQLDYFQHWLQFVSYNKDNCCTSESMCCDWIPFTSCETHNACPVKQTIFSHCCLTHKSLHSSSSIFPLDRHF